jgi:hypothetical protein
MKNENESGTSFCGAACDILDTPPTWEFRPPTVEIIPDPHGGNNLGYSGNNLGYSGNNS